MNNALVKRKDMNNLSKQRDSSLKAVSKLIDVFNFIKSKGVMLKCSF